MRYPTDVGVEAWLRRAERRERWRRRVGIALVALLAIALGFSAQRLLGQSKKPGVGLNAAGRGCTHVKYRHGNGPWVTNGRFDASARAFLVADGGPSLTGGAGTIDTAGYPQRYGGAGPGVRWQGASAEKLMAVPEWLNKAFEAGKLGPLGEYDGNPTWQEVIDYVACWAEGTGPAKSHEYRGPRSGDGSQSNPFKVDVPGRPYGDAWQLADGRYVINIHGTASGEKAEIEVPGELSPTPTPAVTPAPTPAPTPTCPVCPTPPPCDFARIRAALEAVPPKGLRRITWLHRAHVDHSLSELDRCEGKRQ